MRLLSSLRFSWPTSLWRRRPIRLGWLPVVVWLILGGGWSIAEEPDPGLLIQQWTFGRTEDLNLDGWPDGWTRRFGRGYPRYVRVSIESGVGPAGPQVQSLREQAARGWLAWEQGRWPWQVVFESVPLPIDNWLESQGLLRPYLRIAMDGGAAELQLPTFELEPGFGYHVAGTVATSDLNGFDGTLELQFLDRHEQVLANYRSPAINGDQPWQTLRIGPIEQLPPGAVVGRVVIRVVANSPEAIDGQLLVDRLQLWRAPLLQLQLNRRPALYQPDDRIELECSTPRLWGDQRELRVSVRDPNQERIIEQTLVLQPIEDRYEIGTANFGESGGGWHANWPLPSLPPGFYTISTEPLAGSLGLTSPQATLVVLPPAPQPAEPNRFGWSWPAFDLSQERPSDALLYRSGAGWLKLPIWCDLDTPQALPRLIDRIEQLESQQITPVGVIAQPPADVLRHFPQRDRETLAKLLLQFDIWRPLLEPILKRVTFHTNHIQVGWDDDASLAEHYRRDDILHQLGYLSQLSGEQVELVVPWDAEQPVPASSERYISRLQRLSPAPLQVEPSARPASRTAAVPEAASGTASWESLQPLTAGKHDLLQRSRDLAERMVRLVVQQTDVGWIHDPSHPDAGLVSEAGEPLPLWLPFRQLAHYLSGCQAVGELPLPGGSRNWLLERQGRGILLTWNDEPKLEPIPTLFDAQAYDVLGSERSLGSDFLRTGQAQLQIDHWPVLVDGVDLKVARWQMGIRLRDPFVPSEVNRQVTLAVELDNPEAGPVAGTLRLLAPELIEPQGEPVEFLAAADGAVTIELPVTLLPNAETGEHLVELEVTADLEPTRTFRVPLPVRIGNPALGLAIVQKMSAAGTLLLEFTLDSNQPEARTFDISVYPAGRPRERLQMVDATAGTQRSFVLPNAAESIGRPLWIRAHELGSDQVLNYRLSIAGPGDERPDPP
jgi:hypothetical protein